PQAEPPGPEVAPQEQGARPPGPPVSSASDRLAGRLGIVGLFAAATEQPTRASAARLLALALPLLLLHHPLLATVRLHIGALLLGVVVRVPHELRSAGP